MTRTGIEKTVVPSFDSPDDLQAGLDAKSRFEPADLYPRDGSLLLSEVENHIADLARIDRGLALAYVSGMAAVTAAVDAALYHAEPQGKLPVLACSMETYTQTRRYFNHFLKGKRADVVYFDSGDTDEVDRIIDERKPDVLVAETVGNYLSVPVLDTDHLLSSARSTEKAPIIVLDNTLPLSTALPLGQELRPDEKTIVVESGTKSYTHNEELLGVAYTKNEILHDFMRRQRRTRGDIPVAAQLEGIAAALSPSLEEFDDRNLRLFRNTGNIAIQLYEGLDGDRRFVISHPEISAHDNHELYKARYPFGASPILNVYSPGIPQLDVVKALWRHPGVREHATLGQSFGFDYARIVHDENVEMVRIAGGAYTDGAALGLACAGALKELRS